MFDLLVLIDALLLVLASLIGSAIMASLHRRVTDLERRRCADHGKEASE